MPLSKIFSGYTSKAIFLTKKVIKHTSAIQPHKESVSSKGWMDRQNFGDLFLSLLLLPPPPSHTHKHILSSLSRFPCKEGAMMIPTAKLISLEVLVTGLAVICVLIAPIFST